ncbi:MAG: hypothetical protein QXK61_08425, partial [Nitrososphaerota archaeon]
MMDSPSLPNVYENVCRGLGYDERPLLSKALEKVEERVSKGEDVILFLEAPTGYGKSTLSLALYAALRKGRHDVAQRIIHVLPMRSIGIDLKNRMTSYANTLSTKGLPVNVEDIGLQQMHSPGSPMLCKRFVITTLDTFITSFFKMPAAEIYNVHHYGTAHYEVPRACIYS